MLASNLPRIPLRYAEKIPILKVLFIKLTIKEAILTIVECIASLIGGSVAMMHLLVPQPNDSMPLRILKNVISMAIGMFTGIAMVITVDEIVKKSTALCYECNYTYTLVPITNVDEITFANTTPTPLSSSDTNRSFQHKHRPNLG